MKNFLIIISFFLLITKANAQTSHNYEVSISYDISKTNYSSFSRVLCDCSYEGLKYHGGNLLFGYKIYNKLWLKTGISYQKALYRAKYFPSGVLETRDSEVENIIVPLIGTYYFNKYLSLETGLFMRKDIKNELGRSKGIGILVGGRIQYPFSNGSFVYMNPYYQIHDLIASSKNLFLFNHVGISVGMGFYFQ